MIRAIQKRWRLTGTVATLAVAATIGLYLFPLATTILIVAAATGAAGVLYVLACLRRSASVAVVILLTALLDRTLRSVLSAIPGSSYVTYLDDAALGIAALICGYHWVRTWLRKQSFRGADDGPRPRRDALSAVPHVAWIGFAVFAASGILSALIGWTNPAGLLPGIWLALKLPITLIVVTSLRWRDSCARPLAGVIAAVFAVHVLTAVVEYIAPGLVHDVFGASNASRRMGISSLKGIFDHPAQSATFCLFVTVVFSCGPVARWQRVLGIVAGLTAAASLRVKSLINLIVIGGMRSIVGGSRRVRIAAPVLMVVAAAGVIFAAWGLIASRFSSVVADATSPRARLISTSLQISIDRFGFGGGFGSFASEASRSAYSPLWAEYGLDQSYGFVEGNARFATDLSWATVVGETGIIGGAGMLTALVAMLAVQLPQAWRHRATTWHLSATTFLTVIVVDSFASPRLFDGFAIAGLGVFLALTTIQRRESPRAEVRAEGR